MTPRRRLGTGFEHLEDRSLPTAFGIPWPDPGHLSLSFVPDGASTPTGPSQLYSTLNAVAPAPVWQREILRAYQTWAAQTNIDVRLVPDAGYALGTAGAVQGDTRFGDVRVAAAAQAPGTVAAASPFGFAGTTFAGDLVMTAGNPFAVGNVADEYDVFSVALHEAGHSLGLDHTDAPGSVLNEEYAYHPGLSAGDVAAIRGLYGVRSPDAHDAAGRGNTRAAAVPVPREPNSLTRFVAAGDMTTTGDVDYYKFTVPPVVSLAGASVRLKAGGQSLLTGKITVTTAGGAVIGSDATTNPLDNDLAVGIGPTLFGGTYVVKVEGATGDVFGIGGYHLVVDLVSLGTVVPPLAPLLDPLGDLVVHNLLGTVTGLLSTQTGAPDARFDYTHSGIISQAAADTYRVRAPQAADPTRAMALNVMAWGLDANPVDPRVRVFDAAGQPVAFQVLGHADGLMSVQVRDVAPGADYFVRVAAQATGAAAGRYFLAADYNQFTPTELTGAGGDALNPGSVAAASLTVNEAGIYQFGLAAQLLSAAPGGVTVTVTDAAGRDVLALTAAGGQLPKTRALYLAAGAYTVRYTYAAAGGGQPAGAVRYDLFLTQLTEGVGPYSTRTSGEPGGTSPPPPPGGGGYTYTGSSPGSGNPYYF
jgi:hypothetical protein